MTCVKSTVTRVQQRCVSLTDDEEREMFVCELTDDDLDKLTDGVSLHFEYDGAVIEQNPEVIIEVADD